MQPDRDGRPDHEAAWGALQQRLARAYDGLPDLPSDASGVTPVPARPPLPAGSSVAPVALEPFRPIRGLPVRRRRWDPFHWRWLASAGALAIMGGLLGVAVFGQLAPIRPPALEATGLSLDQQDASCALGASCAPASHWSGIGDALSDRRSVERALRSPDGSSLGLGGGAEQRGTIELPVITLVGHPAPSLAAPGRPGAGPTTPAARPAAPGEGSAPQLRGSSADDAKKPLATDPSEAPLDAPVDWQAVETGRAAPGSEDVTYQPGHDRTVPSTDQQIPSTRLEPDHAAHRGKVAVP